MNVDHVKYMKLALDQAEKSLNQLEVPVGCVIVDQNGIVISEGLFFILCHIVIYFMSYFSFILCLCLWLFYFIFYYLVFYFTFFCRAFLSCRSQ
jgi:hypothetical protein